MIKDSLFVSLCTKSSRHSSKKPHVSSARVVLRFVRCNRFTGASSDKDFPKRNSVCNSNGAWKTRSQATVGCLRKHWDYEAVCVRISWAKPTSINVDKHWFKNNVIAQTMLSWSRLSPEMCLCFTHYVCYSVCAAGCKISARYCVLSLYCFINQRLPYNGWVGLLNR